MVVGLAEGAELVIERFLRIKYLDIDGFRFFTDQKNMKSQEHLIGVRGALHEYEFVNPWMALNQKNHALYLDYSPAERKKQLENILISNLISFFKAVGYQETQQMMASLSLKEGRSTSFKNQQLLTFAGRFVVNVQLPDYIGLGKSVSRGFGTIRKVS